MTKSRSASRASLVVSAVVWLACAWPSYLLWQRWRPDLTFAEYLVVFLGPAFLASAAGWLVERARA